MAVQRAMTVKVIQENNAFGIEGEQRENLNSVQKKNSRKIISRGRKEEQARKTVEQERAPSRFNRKGRKEKECW